MYHKILFVRVYFVCTIVSFQISASIISKKSSEGLNCLVLDVKVGSGALMKTVEDAERLAKALVDAGNRIGNRIYYVSIVITTLISYRSHI